MNFVRDLKRRLSLFCNFFALFIFKSNRVRNGALFIVGTEGDYFERSFAQFNHTSFGPKLLDDKPDVVALLADRKTLAAYPAGSLGRSYLEFMQDFGLDETFYHTEVLQDLIFLAKDAKRAWYRERLGNHHDLYHVLSGYGPDDLGEAGLMAFRYGQTRHRGLLALSLAMSIRQALRPRALACIFEAYRRGCRATPLEMLPWELSLELPLATVRSSLAVAPSSYCPAETAYAPKAYVDALPETGYADLECAQAWSRSSIGSSVANNAG